MAFRDKNNRSRSTFMERINLLFKRGPKLDDDFWDDLEETLILSDLGPRATMQIIDNLQEEAHRQALPDSYAVLDMLSDQITELFTEVDLDPFHMRPVCILFVGINGAGKTTTVGKLANQATIGGRNVLIGSADTFRAAAIEQLDIWGERSGVEVVKRERGSDPASVCYDVIERAEQLGSDMVLIDTSGRLHTSDELMRELQKVVNVTRKRAHDIEVKTVLVIDATTGQNGLQQAREFDKALDLDGVIMTKLDGTAKGGIAVAVSHELGLPILRIGVGEGIEDLQPFDAREYADALFGELRGGSTSQLEFEEADETQGTEAHPAEEQYDEDISQEAVDETPDSVEFYFPPEDEDQQVEPLPVFDAELEEEDAELEEEDAFVDITLEAEDDDALEDGALEDDTPEDEGALDEEDELGEDDGLDEEPADEQQEEAEVTETFREKMRRWFL